MNSPDQQPTISERIDTVWSMAEQGLFEGHETAAIAELALLSIKVAAFKAEVGRVAVAHVPQEDQAAPDGQVSRVEEGLTGTTQTRDAKESSVADTTTAPPVSHPHFQPGPHSRWGKSGRSLRRIRKDDDDAEYVPKNFQGGRVETTQQDTKKT